MAASMSLAAAQENMGLRGRLAKWKEESKETMEKAYGSLASGATGFGLGYYASKYGPDKQKVLGLDLEVVVAAAGLGMALIPQVSRKLGASGASIAEGVGNGALSIYGYKMGLERGKQK